MFYRKVTVGTPMYQERIEKALQRMHIVVPLGCLDQPMLRAVMGRGGDCCLVCPATKEDLTIDGATYPLFDIDELFELGEKAADLSDMITERRYLEVFSIPIFCFYFFILFSFFCSLYLFLFSDICRYK